MVKFRIRFHTYGVHVHCKVYSAKPPYTTWAKLGELTLSKGVEMLTFVQNFKSIEVLPDQDEQSFADACIGGE